MISNKVKCDINWRALEDIPTLAQKTMGLEVSTPVIPSSSTT